MLRVPRLTISAYLLRRRQLQALWTEHRNRFSGLSAKDQMALHKYYLLTVDKAEPQLITHRRDVAIGDPSLPQRAGRAYARLMRGEMPTGSRTVMQNGRAITISVLARPEPDLRLLATAVIAIAMRESRERRDTAPNGTALKFQN